MAVVLLSMGLTAAGMLAVGYSRMRQDKKWWHLMVWWAVTEAELFLSLRAREVLTDVIVGSLGAPYRLLKGKFGTWGFG